MTTVVDWISNWVQRTPDYYYTFWVVSYIPHTLQLPKAQLQQSGANSSQKDRRKRDKIPIQLWGEIKNKQQQSCLTVIHHRSAAAACCLPIN